MSDSLMSWLLRDGDVLASVEDRRRGWQASLQGALVLRGPTVVQTLTAGQPQALDVAWCARAELNGGRQALRVRRIGVVGPRRVRRPTSAEVAWWWRRPGPSSAGASRWATASRSAAIDAAAARPGPSGPGGRVVLVGTPDRQPR